MNKTSDFEYFVLNHYLKKGTFVRNGIIQQLIDDLRKMELKENYCSIPQEYGLNHDEVISSLQIAIISHIMMFIEDLAVISKAISEGKIDYYDYLDKSGDDDLGIVIRKFYENICAVSDETFEKLLSFTDLSNFEFGTTEEKEIIGKIMKKMIERVKIFFNKIIFFRENHIKIFRRYKHAGFPILLIQKIPEVMAKYPDFKFVSVGLTSRENIDEELIPIPYSNKAIESYENIKNDIFSFFGFVLHAKLICLEREVSGLIPHTSHTMTIELSNIEKQTLEKVWKKFEIQHPRDLEGQPSVTVFTTSKILKWYTEIDNSIKRTL